MREAFFPGEAGQRTVEPAGEDDVPQIRALARNNHAPAKAATICRWLECAPEKFVVVRDDAFSVMAFRSCFAADTLPADAMRADPILRGWLGHLRRHPIAGSGQVFFVPYDNGYTACAATSAWWLNVKRLYPEMGPHLRRVYVARRLFDPTDGAMRDLGFKRLPDLDVTVDGDRIQSVMLDMGPGSVDGWLTGLVAAEPGVSEDERGIVDAGLREMLVA